jgi:hypothetical protein
MSEKISKKLMSEKLISTKLPKLIKLIDSSNVLIKSINHNNKINQMKLTKEKKYSKEKFFIDIYKIFTQSMKNQQYTIGLKAIEIIGKYKGFLKSSYSGEKNSIHSLDFSSMSEEELQQMIDKVESTINKNNSN